MLFTSCRITGKKTNFPSIFHYQSLTKKCYSFMYFQRYLNTTKIDKYPMLSQNL